MNEVSGADRHILGTISLQRRELVADFGQLNELISASEEELITSARDLRSSPLRPSTRRLIEAQIKDAQERSSRIRESLAGIIRKLSHCRSPSREYLDELSATKMDYADLIRTELSLAASIATAADWQSPTLDSSGEPSVGRDYLRIRLHHSEYKRDRCLDAQTYESHYVDQMVDGISDVRALLTSCGMAALTTVLAYLRKLNRLSTPVLMPNGTYHETREILQNYGIETCVFDRTSIDSLNEALGRIRPRVVFLEALPNSRSMSAANVEMVMESLRDRDVIVVFDNTTGSIKVQPWQLAGRSMQMVVVESLVKYAQFGMDRVNAGIIVARKEDAAVLDELRENLGTNITNVSARTLPRVRRRVLTERLDRIWRNANVLATRLQCHAGFLVEVGYPGAGGLLSITPRRLEADQQWERLVLRAAVLEARMAHIGLDVGASFGFNTTRIYITASRRDSFGELPYFRISAGTENCCDIERVAEVLVRAVHMASNRSLEIARAGDNGLEQLRSS